MVTAIDSKALSRISENMPTLIHRKRGLSTPSPGAASSTIGVVGGVPGMLVSDEFDSAVAPGFIGISTPGVSSFFTVPNSMVGSLTVLPGTATDARAGRH
ncbi:hypothetical protein GCM10027056_02150 [Glaciibacter psychrotolerans]